jgi:hypothetical protein
MKSDRWSRRPRGALVFVLCVRAVWSLDVGQQVLKMDGSSIEAYEVGLHTNQRSSRGARPSLTSAALARVRVLARHRKASVLSHVVDPTPSHPRLQLRGEAFYRMMDFKMAMTHFREGLKYVFFCISWAEKIDVANNSLSLPPPSAARWGWAYFLLGVWEGTLVRPGAVWCFFFPWRVGVCGGCAGLTRTTLGARHGTTV